MFIHGDMGKKSTKEMWDECNRDVEGVVEPYKNSAGDSYDHDVTAENICGDLVGEHSRKAKLPTDWVKSTSIDYPEMWEWSGFAPKKENKKRMHYVSKSYRNKISDLYKIEKNDNTRFRGGRRRRRTLRRKNLHTRRK